MFKNHFKIAWRNLLKDRQFTALNLLGLATGIACALLIYMWVHDELTVDKFNEKDARLYQVMMNLKTNDGIKTGDYTPGLLGKTLQEEIPEIEYSVSVLPASWFNNKGVLSFDDKKVKADGAYVGKEYFNVFSCDFLKGDKNKIINDKYSIALSEDFAKKVFGTTDEILGKRVNWNLSEFGGEFVVAGIFKKNPANSTDRFDLMLNYQVVLDGRPNLLKWGNSDPNTYVIVKEGTDIAKLNEKIKFYIQKKEEKTKEDAKTIFLTRYSDRYLHGNYENGVQAGGRIAYVNLFSIIAIVILLIACINFMNLSTAKATKRIKEVGIQKVVGARRSELILQYLCESVLMAFFSLVLALMLVLLMLPIFNQITGKQLELYHNQELIVPALLITLITGLLAGSYPAFYLSSFRPALVLKGKLNTSFGELWARRGLVVFQFTLSVIFIAAVLIVYRQINFIQSKNLGYNRENVIHFEIPIEFDSAKLARAASFVNELKNIPGVVNASSYYHNLTGDHGGIGGFEWPGREPGKDIDFANLEVGYNFLETIGIKIKEGRGFSYTENSNKEIIFNESAIKAMGLKDPIGKTVKFWDQQRQIVGVTEDFNFESLYSNVKPCFFQVYPVMPNVMVRIKGGTERQTISAIEKAYATFNKGMAFDYKFLDEDYQALYVSENRVSLLSRYFAGLAVIISCLGLFGLSAFTAQKRQKEIGIRKVVGASVGNITYLLSKEFIKLVLVAVVIAFPVAWWAMNKWLSDFAFRVDIGVDVFLITAFFAFVITALSVSFQSIKAAIANPVKSLRTE